jgi:curved DNA-binding protein CbpA
MKNPYEILGVEKTASEEEIKKAFRKKSKETHPDAGGNAAEFRKVAAANKLLSNPENRAEYDRTGIWEEDTETSRPEKVLVEMYMEALKVFVTTGNQVHFKERIACKLDQNINEFRAQREEAEIHLRRLIEHMEKTKGPEHRNVIGLRQKSIQKGLEQTIEVSGLNITLMEEAKSLLKDYDFNDIEEPDDIWPDHPMLGKMSGPMVFSVG